MDDILRDFLVETNEHIEAAGAQLVELERDPSDRDMIASIFRLVHTIKGTCGFLGLARLARVAHAAETVIGRMRDGARASPETVTLILSTVDRVKRLLAEIEATGGEPEGEDDELIAALAAHAKTMSAAEAAENAPTAPPEPDAAPAPLGASQAPDHGADAHGARAHKPDSIRVTIEALESLMLLVSELVLTRNQLTEVTRSSTDEAVKGALQRLSSVATDLQDAVMRARMQPMSRIFGTLPRLVRDLAAQLGKKIELVTEGAETELDRQLIELVRDPLTHMIRNCADHGLETTQERVAAAKPETGCIRISAAHEAGQIAIEVADDGRGLDCARIRRKAVALGLATDAEIAALSDEDVCRFIFAPGFSTAARVTDISGRGVGLDVVRENIEAIGGVVSVASTPGAGARFSIRIPLTLAISPALIVSIAGQKFALPQLGVVEVVGLGPESPHALDMAQGALVLRLRDQVLPVCDLAELLRLAPRASAPGAPEERLVIVVRVASSTFGVIVNSVDDVQEIVVKPLNAQLSSIRVFSGQTILGDGAVVLILDSAGVAATLGVQRTSQYRVARPPDPVAPKEAQSRVVLLRAGPGVSKALPLSLITRIESVDAAQIERTGQGLVLRHRSRLTPLLPAAEGVKLREFNQPVLVVGVGGETMGLLVDDIVDIVEAPLDVQIAQDQPGVLGSAEFGGAVAELLDLAWFIRAARPDSVMRGVNRRFRILLVDDRLFFREMLAPVLTAAGYTVTTRDGARSALTLIEKGVTFDAIVTDTDMPEMDGYTFARTLNAHGRWRETPVVALAAHVDEKTLAAAKACGMRAVAGKFDRKGLLRALDETLEKSKLSTHTLEERILAETGA